MTYDDSCPPPWMVPHTSVISYEATLPQTAENLPPPAQHFQHPDELYLLTDHCEEAEHYRTTYFRYVETAAPSFPTCPVGTWAADRRGELYQLREYRLDDPNLRYRETAPFASNHDLGYAGMLGTVEKYVTWIKAGQLPPPGRGVELLNGKIQLHDGHHRAAALHRAGKETIQMWVSPCTDRCVASTGYGISHERAVSEAVGAGLPVPTEVLAGYPNLEGNCEVQDG